ncbi:MAG: SWIM zinc finger domain-containing protein, partial [Victivallaceae bacterium]
MAKTFEEKLVESSGEDTLKAAKQILKHNALAGAWRDPEGVIHARIAGNTLQCHVAVTPGNPATAVCSCPDRSGKLCEHAVAALLYCGRFNPAAIKPVGETASAYAGLKYQNLEELAGRENTEKNATLHISVSSEFPHVPSKWENAVLNVKLRNKEREYLGNVNNLRQLFFDKKLSISLKIDDFSLQEQQIIRFLAINGEPDNSNVLLNSEQTAEFFHCLVGFKNFTRDGRRLLVRGDRAEPVILRQQTADGLKISAGIRVGHALLPISNAKVITGRSGCWIGREGEYYFIPAVVDIGFLRNFFRTGEQFFPGKISENFLDHGRFPLPVLDAKVLELEEAPLAVLLTGKLNENGHLNVMLRYLYGDEAFAPGSGRLARIGSSFVKRDECAELRLENELEMFGFRREEDRFILDDSEGIGVFLQELLPLWLRNRSNYALNGELALLSRGGGGLEDLSVRNQVKG